MGVVSWFFYLSGLTRAFVFVAARSSEANAAVVVRAVAALLPEGLAETWLVCHVREVRELRREGELHVLQMD